MKYVILNALLWVSAASVHAPSAVMIGSTPVKDDPTTFFVDGKKGKDDTLCGGKASPCKSIPHGIQRIPKDVHSPILQIASGEYIPERGQDPYIVINRSLTLQVDSTAEQVKIDCKARGSALDVLVSSDMHVEIVGLNFFNCTGLDSTAEKNALRPWRVGGRMDWCDYCGCTMGYCGRAGGVSIVQANYQDLDTFFHEHEEQEKVGSLENVHIKFRRCAFENNRAQMGGALQLMLLSNYSSSSFQFESCRFKKNAIDGAAWTGPKAPTSLPWGLGSAFYVQTDIPFNFMQQKTNVTKNNLMNTTLKDVNITFDNCNVTENNNSISSGTMLFWMTLGKASNFLVEFANSHLVHNDVAKGGGGVDFYGPTHTDPTRDDTPNITVRFTRSNVSFNRGAALPDHANANALGSGGGAHIVSPIASLRDPIDDYGVYNNQFVFHIYKSVVEIMDSVFEGNSGGTGGAFSSENGYIHIMRSNFTNNIGWQTSGAVHLGGQDSAANFEDTVFVNNSAGRQCHTLRSVARGPVNFTNAAFSMYGSAQGVSDICLQSVGPADVDAKSLFECPKGYVLQTPTRSGSEKDKGGFDMAYTTLPFSSWNGKNSEIAENDFQVQCFQCPPGRYQIAKPALHGPMWSQVCSNGFVHAFPPRPYGCEQFLQVQRLDGQITNQISQNPIEACAECPPNGNCTKGSEVYPAGPLLYGFQQRGNQGARKVGLTPCKRGFCRNDNTHTLWDDTCLANRDPASPLCGACKEGYSETWFGSYPCVKDEECKSLVWAAPLSIFCLMLYGFYIYVTAQRSLYIKSDAWLLFFQMFPLMTMDSWTGFGSSIFSSLSRMLSVSLYSGSSEEVTDTVRWSCLAPGLRAWDKIFLGFAPIIILSFGTWFSHFCAKRIPAVRRLVVKLLGILAPEMTRHAASSATQDEELQLPTSGLETLTSGASSLPVVDLRFSTAAIKCSLFIYSAWVQIIFKLVATTTLSEIGGNKCVLSFAGHVQCGAWQYFVAALGLAVVVPFPLLTAVGTRAFMPDGIRLWMTSLKAKEITHGGVNPRFWWWGFFQAFIRGVLAMLPGIVHDRACLAVVNITVIFTALGVLELLPPFTGSQDMVRERVIFYLLIFAAATSMGTQTLIQGSLQSTDQLTTYTFLTQGVSAACVTVAAFAFGGPIAQKVLLTIYTRVMPTINGAVSMP